MEDNLHKGHRERMRAAYRRQGLPAEPHRQLEMLLYYARPQVDTNETAHRLLKRFGSLKGVLEAGVHELEETEGVGIGVATFLQFMGDIARETNAGSRAKPGMTLDTEERMGAFVKKRLCGQKCECVLIAYLDPKGRLIQESLTKDAALSSARVENSLRVTVKTALQSRAAGVLVGHNHPDGSPMPSQKDVAEAKRLKEALRYIGVGLADFIIIGEDGETYSLARGGLLI
jgi:DNA repair protein RadC